MDNYSAAVAKLTIVNSLAHRSFAVDSRAVIARPGGGPGAHRAQSCNWRQPQRRQRKRKTNFISANAYRVNAVQFRRLLVRRRRGPGEGEGRGSKAPAHKLAHAGGWMGLIFSVPSGITEPGSVAGLDAGTQMVRLIVTNSPYCTKPTPPVGSDAHFAQ